MKTPTISARTLVALAAVEARLELVLSNLEANKPETSQYIPKECVKMLQVARDIVSRAIDNETDADQDKVEGA